MRSWGSPISGARSTARTASSLTAALTLGACGCRPRRCCGCCSSTAGRCPGARRGRSRSSVRGPNGSSTSPVRCGAMTSASSRRPARALLAIPSTSSRASGSRRCSVPRRPTCRSRCCSRALEREGLLDVILSLIDEHAAGEQEDELEPILLSVSDNGAQMRSGSTREFMALHAIATHYGPPRDADRSGPHRVAVRPRQVRMAVPVRAKGPGRPIMRARRRTRVQQYNRVRLHAGISYVTPDDEHEGRGPAIRQARRAGLARPRAAPGLQPRHPPEADRMTTTPPNRQQRATDHPARLAAGPQRAAQRAGSRRDRPNRARRALSGRVAPPLGSSAADLTSPSAKLAQTVRPARQGPAQPAAQRWPDRAGVANHATNPALPSIHSHDDPRNWLRITRPDFGKRLRHTSERPRLSRHRQRHTDPLKQRAQRLRSQPRARLPQRALGRHRPRPRPPRLPLKPLHHQPDHLLIRRGAVQRQPEHVVHHHPRRQQPRPTLRAPGLRDHLINHPRRKHARQHSDRDVIRKTLIRLRLDPPSTRHAQDTIPSTGRLTTRYWG